MIRGVELSLPMLISSSIATTVYFAEGGVDVYLPGFCGDFQMAALPDKGLYYENYMMYSKVKTDVTMRQDQLHIDIDDEIFANLFSLLFTADKKTYGSGL
jgi:hypothetical protein